MLNILIAIATAEAQQAVWHVDIDGHVPEETARNQGTALAR